MVIRKVLPTQDNGGDGGFQVWPLPTGNHDASIFPNVSENVRSAGY